MASATVYEGVADNENVNGTLFAGKKFFLTQRLPMRKHFLDSVKSNGGTIVLLEKKADYVIADHIRRDCPPGSISYTFIEQCIKHGEIVDPEDHLAGPAADTLREAGSSKPTKTSRTPYTAEDDRILYKWVKDHERKGTGMSSGNELYKQLEQKCPRHTWQSWRDRYVKRLKDNPPAGLHVPDNAPPSPSSAESPDREAPVPAPTKSTKTTTSIPRERTTEKASKKQPSPAPQNQAQNPAQNTAAELRELFDEESYEELYANVETIIECNVKEYRSGWDAYAEGNPYTARQWRLFFEEVVLKDWDKDPETKREAIKTRVHRRHDAFQESEAENNTSQPSTPKGKTAKPQSGLADAQEPDEDLINSYVEKFLLERKCNRAQEAYIFWARERGNGKGKSLWDQLSHLTTDQLHKQILTHWHALPDEEKALFIIMEKADKRRAEIERQSSASSAVQETPDYIAKTHRKIMKRISDGNVDHFSRDNTSSPPTKRRKREVDSPEHIPQQQSVPESIREPVDISSTSETSSAQDDESRDIEIQEGEPDERTPTAPRIDVDYPQLNRQSRDELPPASPTPRKPGGQGGLFDTQAILSSPIQPFSLRPIPPPAETQDSLPSREVTPEELSSSPLHQGETEGSVSESLQEFRDSLQDARSQSLNPDMQSPSPTLPPLPPPEPDTAPLVPIPPLDRQTPPLAPIPPPESDAASEVSDTSTDPDPPLQPEEFADFYAEQEEQGFTEEEIRAALAHTFCRPMLTVEILDAWKDGKGLPRKRGIWSADDDRDVESGDGLALAKLERLHTDRGWGGIEERLGFLETYRSRMAAQNGS